jgi:GNAT superfamily N-acetyltransferase
MKIAECSDEHLPVAAELFNSYRMFYEQASDSPACHTFLKANLEGERSRIFLLFDDAGKAIGFAQLCRQQGHARRLMNFISKRMKAEGASRLTLDTATSNRVAQRLYRSLGYEQEQVYVTFHQHLQADSEAAPAL